MRLTDRGRDLYVQLYSFFINWSWASLPDPYYCSPLTLTQPSRPPRYLLHARVGGWVSRVPSYVPRSLLPTLSLYSRRQKWTCESLVCLCLCVLVFFTFPLHSVLKPPVSISEPHSHWHLTPYLAFPPLILSLQPISYTSSLSIYMSSLFLSISL